MPTMKQRKAAGKVVENGGNVAKAMVDAGYSKATANNPQNLTKAKGFQELMDELGLTDDLIVSALVEDIKAKKQNRKPELELAAKMRGRLTEKVESEHTGTLNVIYRPTKLPKNFDGLDG